jgi:hypothetical protein
VERVFEPLYRTPALHVSKDGFTLQRPTTGDLGRTPNDHFDQGARFVGLHCVQGSVALTDQGPDDGCFQVWPGSHHHHEVLLSSCGQGQKKKREDFIILGEAERAALAAAGVAPLRVPVAKGTVVLWRSDVAHCGAPPLGATDHFRGVAYVCALPATLTPPSVLVAKARAVAQLETGCHWPSREEWFRPRGTQQKKRVLASGVQPFLKSPPPLSRRLEELYGLRPYETPGGCGGGGGGGFGRVEGGDNGAAAAAAGEVAPKAGALSSQQGDGRVLMGKLQVSRPPQKQTRARK